MRSLEAIGLELVHAVRKRTNIERELSECRRKIADLEMEAASFYDPPPPATIPPVWPVSDQDKAQPLRYDALRVLDEVNGRLAPLGPDNVKVEFCAWCPDPSHPEPRLHQGMRREHREGEEKVVGR
jgi:hypothetical protein